MENILDLYASECPENTARLSFDERPCQLIGDVYSPMKMEPGKVQRNDCEYVRNGSSCLLMAYDIDSGQRYGQLRDSRTKKDFAEFWDWLDQKYSHVDHLQIVLDNLNTHMLGSFYENLPIDRASFLRRKIEFHFTPKHASWLNMIEMEFSALSRQCLNRRIGTKEELKREIEAWIARRNELEIKISWAFTVAKARTKMASKYSQINSNL
jgi:hypothetical protein